MESDKRARRVKATGEAKHRKGKIRAAVKPGTGSQSQSQSQVPTNQQSQSQAQAQAAAQAKPKDSMLQFIEAFMAQVGTKPSSRLAWGDSLTPSMADLRSFFKLEADETPYLYCNLGRTSAGNAGLVLASPGIRINDGSGTVSGLTWKELTQVQVGAQGDNLILATSVIPTPDARVLGELLANIKSRIRF